MTRCSFCGRENDDSSRYCADCGKPLERASRPSTGPSRPVAAPDVGGKQEPQACPHCHYAPLLPGLPFCPSCGKRTASPAPGRASGAPPAPGGRTSGFSAVRTDTGWELVRLNEAGEEVSRHPLTGDETSVGRVDADICFPDDPFLSPVHAQIGIRSGSLYLRDLGSRNGTWFFLEEPYVLEDGDLLLVGSQVLRFRRLGYPGPNPPEHDATRRLGSLVPSADIASLTQLRSDASPRDVLHLSPGRSVVLGREEGDWVFPYDPSMSGRHAEVRSEDADFVMMDLGSRNGVAVGVRGEVGLREGSRLLVGDKMLRVEKRA